VKTQGSVIDDTSARDDSPFIDLAQPRIDSPFFDLTQPHQISIMTVRTQSLWSSQSPSMTPLRVTDTWLQKNGIFNLYVSHAQGHIERYETSGKVSKISRARVELELLNAISEGVFPIEYKLCWIKAVIRHLPNS